MLLLAVSVPFIFWGLGSAHLLDPDEGMYGAISREMAEEGDWATPHFNGVRYLEKPPLYFWLTALTLALFGPSEWVIRFWSAVPAVGAALLTWRLGDLLYGRPAGLLAAIVMISGVGVFRHARVAATDFLMVFSLTLSIYGFVKATLGQWSAVNGQSSMVDRQQDGGKRTIDQLPTTFNWGTLLFWLGMALGVLSKGLIGLVFPLLIVGLFVLLAKASSQSSMANHQWGGRRPIDQLLMTIYSPFDLLLFFALIVPWHLLAAWKNPGFLEFYIFDNQFLRFLGNRAYVEDDVPVNTVTFLVLTWIWFFPWSQFLSGTLRYGFPNASLPQTASGRLRLLVGLWAVTVIGFFSLSSSTLEHYFLPAMPPLSLLVGALWSDALSAEKPLPSLKWPLLASAIGCSLVGIGLIFLSERLTSEAIFTWFAEMNVYYRILKEQGAAFPYASVSPFVPLVKGFGVVLLIGLPVSLLFFCLGSPRGSFVSVTVVAGVTGLLVHKLVLVTEPHHSAKSVALVLESEARLGEPMVHEGSLEYSGSLPFYTGRQVYVLNGRRGDLDFGSRYPEAQVIFLNDVEFARLWQNDKRVFLVTRLPEQASVVKSIPPENIHLIGRYDSRSLYSNGGS